MNINKIISKIFYRKLETVTKSSTNKLQQIKEKEVFHSKTLQELMSDRFEYKGAEPNIILVKDNITGKPVEVCVDIIQEPDATGRVVREVYRLWTKDKKKLIGIKDFYLKKNTDKTVTMFQGNMVNCNPAYSGVGIRLDQMQIERALQMGVKSIPRVSYPQAILFHIKMGFLPRTTSLEKLKSLKDVQKISEDALGLAVHDIPLKNIRSNPFIVKMDDKYYLDINKTIAMSAIDLCRKILKNTGVNRVIGLDIATIRMSLRGQELEKWRQIIQQHPILSRLIHPPEYPF